MTVSSVSSIRGWLQGEACSTENRGESRGLRVTAFSEARLHCDSCPVWGYSPEVLPGLSLGVKHSQPNVLAPPLPEVHLLLEFSP